jgi:tetratricopeptide (TPR) repeat protein
MIIRGVEEMLGKQGFKKIWITNYIGHPPPSDFWRKMGYKFDIDEGYKSLKKYQLKPLPKWTDKLCSEIQSMKDEEKEIKLLERFPENDQIRLLKASTLNELGEYEEAIECCDRTVEQFPYSTRFNDGVQGVKSEALEKLGRHEEALKCWDKNIKHFEKMFKNDKTKFGEFTGSLSEKAYLLEKIGRYDESLKLHEQIIEIDKADENYSDWGGSEHPRLGHIRSHHHKPSGLLHVFPSCLIYSHKTTTRGPNPYSQNNFCLLFQSHVSLHKA